MRCHKRDSTKHFASNCLHRKFEETDMTEHITLVTGKADSLGKGILDSACRKTYQVRNG